MSQVSCYVCSVCSVSSFRAASRRQLARAPEEPDAHLRERERRTGRRACSHHQDGPGMNSVVAGLRHTLWTMLAFSCRPLPSARCLPASLPTTAPTTSTRRRSRHSPRRSLLLTNSRSGMERRACARVLSSAASLVGLQITTLSDSKLRGLGLNMLPSVGQAAVRPAVLRAVCSLPAVCCD